MIHRHQHAAVRKAGICTSRPPDPPPLAARPPWSRYQRPRGDLIAQHEHKKALELGTPQSGGLLPTATASQCPGGNGTDCEPTPAHRNRNPTAYWTSAPVLLGIDAGADVDAGADAGSCATAGSAWPTTGVSSAGAATSGCPGGNKATSTKQPIVSSNSAARHAAARVTTSAKVVIPGEPAISATTRPPSATSATLFAFFCRAVIKLSLMVFSIGARHSPRRRHRAEPPLPSIISNSTAGSKLPSATFKTVFRSSPRFPAPRRGRRPAGDAREHENPVQPHLRRESGLAQHHHQSSPEYLGITRQLGPNVSSSVAAFDVLTTNIVACEAATCLPSESRPHGYCSRPSGTTRLATSGCAFSIFTSSTPTAFGVSCTVRDAHRTITVGADVALRRTEQLARSVRRAELELYPVRSACDSSRLRAASPDRSSRSREDRQTGRCRLVCPAVPAPSVAGSGPPDRRTKRSCPITLAFSFVASASASITSARWAPAIFPPSAERLVRRLRMSRSLPCVQHAAEPAFQTAGRPPPPKHRRPPAVIQPGKPGQRPFQPRRGRPKLQRQLRGRYQQKHDQDPKGFTRRR